MRIDWHTWREATVITPFLASVPYLFIRHADLAPALIVLLMPISVWLLIVSIYAATPQEQLGLSEIAISTALAILPWFFVILFIERYAFWIWVWFVSVLL